MPKEYLIRKKAIEILEKQNWLTWRAPKVRFSQTDIFGVFDMVCWQKKTSRLKFIQLTTLSNLSARRKKIQNFLRKNKISPSVKIELWGWNGGKKTFKVELI
jgi:hypothetical protein